MLSYNCLLKNTDLYKDLQKFVKKIMYDRVSEGKNVSIYSVYTAARNDSTISDVDMNTVGEMYKDIAPQLAVQVGKGILDSSSQVDKATGKSINDAIKKIISNKKTKQYQEVGQLMPGASVVNDILKLFTSDYIDDKNVANKTVMKEMQDAIKKAAVGLLNRENKKSDNKTFEEVLKEALRVDVLSVKDLNGQLNTMEDLFNQVSDEVNKTLAKMEASKKGMPEYKKIEIDQRIEQFRNYAENIKQGAYTLALSTSEQQKSLRGIFKEKYGKEVTVNGVKKIVLDWNKLFTQSKDFRQDISDVLTPKGFTPEQIDKITEALRHQYETLKATSQWKNVAAKSQNKMLNDKAFLARAAAEVVMSKIGNDGQKYSKYDPSIQREVPDWDKWEKEKGQTADQLQDEIKNVIQNTPIQSSDNYLMALKDKQGDYYKNTDNSGNSSPDWKRYASDKGVDEQTAIQKITEIASSSAAQYRQIISDLARINNPAKHVSKNDLEKLSELAQRNGFNDLFHAKVYQMLGLTEEDSDAGRKIEELSNKVKEVLDKGGKMSKLAMGQLLDDMNAVMSVTQGSKSRLLRFSRNFEWVMGNRNAYRISNYLNLVENSLSGLAQINQTFFQAMDKKAAMKEFGKMFTVVKDVALGGKHVDMTDAERLSYQAHEYRFDPNKSPAHNMKAIMSFLPNLALGVLDSAAHVYTMRVMFYNSAVKVRISKLRDNMAKELAKNGIKEKDADKILNSKEQVENFKEQAIKDVSDALYDDTAEKEALLRADAILKIVRANPSPLEIKREADNLMFQNMVSKGILLQPQLEALIKAADTSAKKAIGKEASAPAWINPLSAGLSAAQMKWRSNIKKQIQDGNYNSAAFNILGNAIVMKGIFPFINGAANWGVITVKKLGIGAILGYTTLNKDGFKKSISDAYNLSPKDLEDTMENYNTARNDIALSFQGAFWAASIVGLLLAIRGDDDDDDSFFQWVDNYVKGLSEDNRTRKMIMRWMPAVVQVYNISKGNVNNQDASKPSNVIDSYGQILGFGAMESPITKATKFTSRNHAAAGFGQLVGGIVDLGSYYNVFNSYIDLLSEEQTDKVKNYDTYVGKEILGEKIGSGLGDSDFINGIISGFVGYNLNQDINAWNEYTPKK